MTSNKTPYIVLVTGGAGFLGQHVVGLLQARAEHVTEIRVLDMIPYVNKLDYADRKPVRQYVGSINDRELVRKTCHGVHCVMHLASFVDITLLPDMQFSYKINVEGTQNVIDACREAGVGRLIYCSTMDVAVGKDNIHDGSEDTSKIAYDDNFFQVYGRTKVTAEELVLRANDSQLQTVSLRPVIMYGEQDMRVIGAMMRMVKKYGTYFQISCGKGKMEYAYVGNVAWGFVHTEMHLHEDRSNARDVVGNAFFIGDESPRKNMADFFRPMLQESGCRTFPVQIPQWIIVYPLYILYLILSLISLIYRVNCPYGVASVTFLSRTYLFSHEKAKRVIGYKPIYTFEEAKARCVGFMKSLKTAS